MEFTKQNVNPANTSTHKTPEINPCSFVGEIASNMVTFAEKQSGSAAPNDTAKPESMEIDLGFTKLIVNKFNDGNGVGFVIGMYDKQGDWQDIAMVEADLKNCQEMHYVDCIVWRDPNSEDYTHKFPIGQYRAEEGTKR